MSEALARPQRSQRLAVVCFGLSRSHAHEQPWHAASGLAEGLSKLGHRVLVVTDAVDPPADRGYETAIVPRLFARAGMTREAISVVAGFAPERVFLFVGIARLVHCYRRTSARPSPSFSPAPAPAFT